MFIVVHRIPKNRTDLQPSDCRRDGEGVEKYQQNECW